MGSKGKGRFRLDPMLKQLERLQSQVMEAQEALATETVTASAGGGAVTVVMNGHRELQSIKISREVVDPDDVEMLQDLIVAAINEAVKKATELAESRMGGLAGGLNLPGLM